MKGETTCAVLIVIFVSTLFYSQVGALEEQNKEYLSSQLFEWEGQHHEYFVVWDTELPLWGAYSFVLEIQASGDHTNSAGYNIELLNDNRTLQRIIISQIYQNNQKYTFQVSFYILSDEPLKTNSFTLHLSWDAIFNFHEGSLNLLESSYLEQYDVPTVYNTYNVQMNSFVFPPLSVLQQRRAEISNMFRTPNIPKDTRLNLTVTFTLEIMDSYESSKITSLSCAGIETEGISSDYNLLLGSQAYQAATEGIYEYTWIIYPSQSTYLLNLEFQVLGTGRWKISNIEISYNLFKLQENAPEDLETSINFSTPNLILSLLLLFTLPLIKFIQVRRKYIQKSKKYPKYSVIKLSRRH